MSEANFEFWHDKERRGHFGVQYVLGALSEDWVRTGDLADKLEMSHNLVLNICHYLRATNRARNRISGTGKRRGYEWKLVVS